MSPKRTPAKAAGPAIVGSTTSTPLALRSPRESASGSSTGSILMPSQPFWPSVERLPTFTGSLRRRPSWAGRVGAAGAGAGTTGWGLGGAGSGCGETEMMGGCPLDGAGTVGMRTMSMPVPATREICGRVGPSDRVAGAQGGAGQAQSGVTAPRITAVRAMPLTARAGRAIVRPCEWRDDTSRGASVIVEAPREDVLGRLLGCVPRYLLGDLLGSVLGALLRLPWLSQG